MTNRTQSPCPAGFDGNTGRVIGQVSDFRGNHLPDALHFAQDRVGVAAPWPIGRRRSAGFPDDEKDYRRFPCYNEEDNVETCYDTVKAIFDRDLPGYEREHIFVDNASSDRTVEILRAIAAKDPSGRWW
ncbi:MAG: glycosyltransferase [Defluviimonas denitrificans]